MKMNSLSRIAFCYFVEDENGTPKLNSIEISDACRTVEAVGKIIAQRCNISPLASYFFGISVNNDDGDPFLTWMYPSYDFSGNSMPGMASSSYQFVNDSQAIYPTLIPPIAIYRLSVIPGSIRRLAEICPKALYQLFLSTKYDLVKNRFEFTTEDESKLKRTINNLLYNDLCRMLMKKFHNKSLSIDNEKSEIKSLLHDIDGIHVKLIKQYHSLNVFSKNSNSWKRFFIPNFVSSAPDRRLASQIKIHVLRAWDKIRIQSEIDFMVVYLEHLQFPVCKNFQRNKYALIKCKERKEALIDLNCKNIVVSSAGTHLVTNDGITILWSEHEKFMNYTYYTELDLLQSVVLQFADKNDLVLNFNKQIDKSSFLFQLLAYIRIFKSFSRPTIFPSQLDQINNNYWGPLCEESIISYHHDAVCEQLKCATAMLCKNPQYNAIAFESAENQIIVFVQIDETRNAIFKIIRAEDGHYWRIDDETMHSFTLFNLLPTNIHFNFFTCPDGILPPFDKNADCEHFIETRNFNSGYFNYSIGTRDKKKIVIKRVLTEFTHHPDAHESFRFAKHFLNHTCENIRRIFAIDYTMTRHGSIGLVMEYFPQKLKTFLNEKENSKLISPRLIINSCRSLIQAVAYLKRNELVHSAINCANMLIDPHGDVDKSRIVLSEPSKINHRPYTFDSSPPSHSNDIFAMGITLREILNFGSLPPDVYDPYHLPVPAGCMVWSYNRTIVAHNDPLSVQYVGFHLLILSAECWRKEPPTIEELLAKFNNIDFHLKDREGNSQTIVVNEGERLVITGEYDRPPLIIKPMEGNENEMNGNFGIVSKVYEINANPMKFFALKRLKNSQIAENLFIEIQIMMNCDHENVLKCVGYTIGKEDKIDGILMPFMKNKSLKDFLLKNMLKISRRQRLQFCKQIATGMKYLHERGIIHLDLFPRNILLDDDLNVKICDFGLCNADQNKINNYISETYNFDHPIVWAPEWLELINRGTSRRMNFNPEGDVWCFGITLLDMENFHKGIFNGSLGLLRNPDIGAVNALQFDPFLKILILDCTNFEASLRPSWVNIISRCGTEIQIILNTT